MAKLTADLTNAQKPIVYERDDYPGRVVKKEVGPSKSNPGNQMITVYWKPEGPKAGDNPATVRDWVSYAGTDKNGNPVKIDKLCDYINALGVPWMCKNCGTESTKTFIWEKGKPFCPTCQKQADIEFDPDLWDGKRAQIRLDIGKMMNSDEEINNVWRIAPLT